MVCGDSLCYSLFFCVSIKISLEELEIRKQKRKQQNQKRKKKMKKIKIREKPLRNKMTESQTKLWKQNKGHRFDELTQHLKEKNHSNINRAPSF
jgi:hypothetical protein